MCLTNNIPNKKMNNSRRKHIDDILEQLEKITN